MTDNLAPQHPQTETPPKGASVGAHVWGFFAGIISGVAFTQIFGGGMLGVMLAYVCLLPLYLSGLAGGRGPVITATVFGCIAVFLQTMAGAGGMVTALYALVFSVPAMAISRVSLIRTATGPAGFVSGSVVLLTMLTLGCVLLLAAATSIGLMGADIAALTAGVADTYVEVMKDTSPEITGEQLAQVKTLMASSLPGLMALSWLVIHGLNYAIAQWIAGEIGQAERPGFALSELELPNYMVPITVIGAVASNVTEGNIGIVLGAVSMLLGAGFTLVGMAVLHALIVDFAAKRNWSNARRNGLVVFYYIFFMVTQLPLLLAFVLGLLDPWLRTRRKLIKTLV